MALLPYYRAGMIEAGCDEAGRGCLAGPVFAAAVILPPDWDHALLNDSKKLLSKHREEVREAILSSAIEWAVASCSAAEIDQYNILQASILAMHRAIDQLTVRPEGLLIDGNRFNPYLGIPHICLIKGDARYRSIAAASILAKTTRDAYMKEIAQEYPEYGWDVNKGYPTLAHRKALEQLGPSVHHRTSFRVKSLV
jgi:ribonuclease HII